MTATDDLVSRLEGILDGGSRNISERYFEWIETTLSQTDWAKFETALDMGDFAHAAELIRWDNFDIEAELLNSLGKAADANSDYISMISAQSFRYDLKDPNALKWIEGHCAELVGQIDDPTQNAVREVVYRGYFEGYTTKQQAEIIQEFIGLSPKESERLADLATKLAADGVSQDDISRQIADEAAKSRKYRAGVIASNETSEAANRGQYFSTHNACSRGVIDPAKYEAYRIITNDDRTCDICLAVAGEARPLPDGVYPSSGDTIVKMHTSCRCAEGLRHSVKKAEGVIPFMDDNSEYKFSKIDVSFEAARQKKTATSIFVPTIPVVEGVFWGHGLPVLRSFEKFGPESNWLDGIPVLINHEPLNPDTRRVGQIRSPTPNEGERRIDAQTEFYRRKLTPEEAEGIESGEALHGSLYLACYLNFESGVWTNPKTGEKVEYDAIEEPNYVFFEYSLVKQGVVTPEDGAGFNMESRPTTLAIAIESMRKTSNGGTYMKKAESNESNEGGAGTVETEPSEKKPTPTTAETITLEALADQFADLKDAIEVDAQARKVVEFKQSLKPGYADEAESLYEIAKTDPVAFVQEHGHKLLDRTIEHQPARGSPISPDGGAGGFDLRAEQDKLFGRTI